MRALEPMYTQASLQAESAPTLRGRVTGSCAGEVYVEVGTTNQARPLAAITGALGPYILYVPPDVPVRVRWACDPDGDGVLAADALAEAALGQLSQDMALDLRVLDPVVTQRWPLTVDGARAAPLLPAQGATAAPATPGMAPPDAAAPADAAVGPPLPEGPPSDFGGQAPPAPPAR